jgi:uncharacterized membrane protein YkvA (DUF1232 family)
MSEKKDNRLMKSTSPWLLGDITARIKLIWRLMSDRRVSVVLKLLPLSTLIYLVVPTDLFPINPIDDAMIIWLGTYLFVELCPPDVVQEHMTNLQPILGASTPVPGAPNIQKPSNTQDEIIDAEYWEDKTPKSS